MKRGTSTKAIAGACAVLGVLLLLTATAFAGKKTLSLNGKIVGDENSQVTLKIVVKNGEPKKVKGLTYANFDAYCDADGSLGPAPPHYVGEITGSAGKNVGTKIYPDGDFYWVSYPDDGARMVEGWGTVKKGGKKVVGDIAVYNNDLDQCETAKGKYKVSK
jgi:hypothetical protein